MQLKHVARAVLGTVLAAALGLASGCGSSNSASASDNGSGSSGGKIVVLSAENEYGDVAQQIGGSHVTVTSIISDPNADPHDFEAKPSDARQIAAAKIVIANGVGYDDWLDKMLKSHSSSDRTVISAQQVLGLPDDTPNPHLWYKPETMPAVASALAATLTRLDPSNAKDYASNLQTFDTSAQKYWNALDTFKSTYPNVSVAATEPVANYLLDNAKVNIKTPWTLQTDIMNGQDPSAQDSATQMQLFNGKQVTAFVYNEQVVSDLTKKYLAAAKANGIPIVAAYETMPTKMHYVDWMLAELKALTQAASSKTSTDSIA
ncbi:metal ABC transporter solute-binding protein, Zn/Mn family [Bifidobacterium sp.]|jgi:zinc/manganese transport system substrate-binding protein|uniref:metal ABC transporter solute-binding protein, Zn/Mn family n=1 Tax=Bifidobacterium sp. TaxID=41200 RepID=UPI0025B7BE5D|nr:zinc ABC transporter substrate-binding protein [Bifidobacterium sp.]MCH4209463.1 zinc ABC transporter substrate-binding protein [Bifidobacterium sp.]MCI1225126.1 zinc ABC transporter substrate-binding protein [Bifidobacterium sp.]